jgi:histidinol-phosphate/aromatic aminotransferase/cobyric acid decarboxylase-like protein
MNRSGTPTCYHGGAFFSAIGPEFNHLERRHDIIAADVLDAWFPPSPRVIAALLEDLPWLLRTSPPTHCEGLVNVIARRRGVAPANILPGAGSSDLIFRAFRQWLRPSSRVLILDPTYGEYAHVLEHVVGCAVERLFLSRENDYRIDLEALRARLRNDYQLVVLVNPNSPTGQHVPRTDLLAVLRNVPESTLVWIDETYIEFAGCDQSLETSAARSKNVVVCKSMSKVYGLSGARVAYLCGPSNVIAGLRTITPPWAVSLPAQVAAGAALQDRDYYTACYQQTHSFRAQLVRQLSQFNGWEILAGIANFVLCHLPADGPNAAELVAACREHNLFIRDADAMGSRFGGRVVRIAVKDKETNQRMAELIGRALERSDFCFDSVGSNGY